MEKQVFLLSVVIPTRNRQKFAASCVHQVYGVTDDSVQIVVQDNSDNASLKAMLTDIVGTERLKYNYAPDRLTGVENYAKGVELADGEYVCCIGDDDGVMGYITDVVRAARENGYQAIKPASSAVYYWPGTLDRYKTGCAFMEKMTLRAHAFSPRQGVETLISNGFQRYLQTDIVKAYHGVVKKEYFCELNRKTAHYCGGLSPDIYWSVALSLMMEKAVSIDIPLTICGACKVSSTGEAANRLSVGPLKDAPHLIGQTYVWTDQIPDLYCDETIWADSAIHALDDMGMYPLMSAFHAEALLKACINKCMLFGKYNAYKDVLIKYCLANRMTMTQYGKLERECTANMLVRKAKDTMIKVFSGIHNPAVAVEQNLCDVIAAEKYYSSIISRESVKELTSDMNNCAD